MQKLTRPISSIMVIPEPRLLFNYEQSTEDPRDGLTLFGPLEKGKPYGIRFAVAGTPDGIRRFRRWPAAPRNACHSVSLNFVFAWMKSSFGGLPSGCLLLYAAIAFAISSFAEVESMWYSPPLPEYHGPLFPLNTTPSPESRNICAAQQAIFGSLCKSMCRN